MKVNELDIDRRIIAVLENQGIEELYPPQEEALKPVLEGKSTVLAVPTASGKSLVAYIAVLQAFLDGMKSLYIVPLRALASEKFEDLRQFESLGMKVAKTVGDFDSPEQDLKDKDVIIATSERADSLLRHRSDWMHDIGVVVADEIHLINDPNRGPTLEVTLVRLKELNPNMQFVALSATIKNSIELAEWLDAEHIQSDWRPVELKEGIFFDTGIGFADGSVRFIEGKREPLTSMVLDTVKDGGQALVFVNTRRSSESVAERISKALSKALEKHELDKLAELAGIFSTCEEEPTTIGNRLAKCVEGGSAFHNAGLTDKQRKLIEDNFRNRNIKCISATPTLAAGINLPARRVIIRDLRRFDAEYGSVPIPVLEVKQMSGRAGRPQYDPFGEAVLMAKSERDIDFVKEKYILAETESIRSKLGSEPALRTHVLATIATGYARNREELMSFIDRTFFAYQMDVWTIEGMIDNMLGFLEESDLITTSDDGFGATLFGKRTSDLYIDPLSAVILKDAISQSQGVEANDLCILHASCSTPDMPLLYLKKKDHEWVHDLAHENVGSLLIEPPVESSPEMDYYLSALKTASMLLSWMDEEPENDIVIKYGIGPGDIRNRVENGEWLLYSMREIARLYGDPLVGRLNPLVLRIRYGIKEKLLPLVKLRNIGRKRARVLFQAGFVSPEKLSAASIKELESLPGIGKHIAVGIKEQVG
jgi:helicase